MKQALLIFLLWSLASCAAPGDSAAIDSTLGGLVDLIGAIDDLSDDSANEVPDPPKETPTETEGDEPSGNEGDEPYVPTFPIPKPGDLNLPKLPKIPKLPFPTIPIHRKYQVK